MSLELRGGGGLTAVIDEQRGAAVVSLTVPDGRSVLSAVSVETRRRLIDEAPVDADPSQLSWMGESRGGWEVMAPNAGGAGGVDARYEFHGTAGRIPWRVAQHDGSSAVLDAHADDWAFGREIRVTDRALEVTEVLQTSRSRPAAWGSHLAFGGDLLDGPLTLTLPGRAVAGTVDGESADGAALAELLKQPHRIGSALAYIDCEGDGRARLSNGAQGISATITWDARVLPFLWVWIELGGTTGWPWFGAVRALGIEPVSAWPADGTAALVAAGRELTIEAREPRVATVRVELDWASGHQQEDNEPR
ncbi:hypothetical protein BH10ACT7_BH10ACT7_14550 [soil metagenome]